jgi:hypothetical protein
MSARQDRGRPTQQIDGFYDSFAVCPRGTYGHPNVDPGPRTASPDLMERAMEAYAFTRPDTRFANLVSRFSRMFDW